ncbi:hypothetical protein CXG81DRAFT_10478 [Caulochytrium protostelioides]|uniref:Ras GEF n=1 Tax=Caulochytrium protostelioides TaxID=1555241 RepID=A0A4V1IV38_9FUNG|nr:hypothetical protein CXG81DRAFT_10478 [Caulochytrium protostelioides]|eukprot:RKP02709.1 hypothetical protein CXG81DRAFT_10478 [Caulochytrium protostelioides]
MNMEGQVRGGTLEALVERLTVHDQLVDPSYTNTFFLMMHQFTPSPGQVLRLLIGRYNLVCPAALTADEAAIWREQKLVPVRLRVYNALKIWLEHHWTVQDDAILPDLDHFIRTDVAQHQPLLVWRLLDLLERHQQAATRLMLAPDACALGACRSLKRAMVPPSTGARPAPILPKSMVRLHITDVDPLELARQLTLLESHLFLEISPDELIGQACSPGRGAPAPHVRAMTQMSNHMTGWITTSVLSEPDGKRRALMIRHFIKVGERLLALNNFNSLMAVISALNSSTVTRLVKTWNHVATKHRHAFQVLCHAMQNDKNYAAYRTRLRSTAAPCLPFLGLYLTDLTFTEDGNPDMRPGGRLINFDKYLKAGRIIQELQRFQVPYALQPVEALQAYLLDHLGTAVTSPQQLYSMSLAIEPRIPSGNENKLRSMAARARLLDTGKMTLLTVESTAAPLTPLGSMPMDAS